MLLVVACTSPGPSLPSSREGRKHPPDMPNAPAPRPHRPSDLPGNPDPIPRSLTGPAWTGSAPDLRHSGADASKATPAAGPSTNWPAALNLKLSWWGCTRMASAPADLQTGGRNLMRLSSAAEGESAGRWRLGIGAAEITTSDRCEAVRLKRGVLRDFPPHRADRPLGSAQRLTSWALSSVWGLVPDSHELTPGLLG